MLDLASVILRVEMDQTVRITPVEVGNRSVQRDRFREVVSCGAVVSESWNAKQKKYGQDIKNRRRFISHARPPTDGLPKNLPGA